MQNLGSLTKIQYPECPLEGFHKGETMNYVCLDAACKDNLLCCNACLEESHKAHHYLPLKLILNDALQKIMTNQQETFNSDEILVLIQNSRQVILQQYSEIVNFIEQKTKEIEQSQIAFFDSLQMQVVAKSACNKDQIKQLI